MAMSRSAGHQPRWNTRPYPHSLPPVLSHAVLSGPSERGDEPAHLTLTVPLNLSTGRHDARWLLAESSWADLFAPPGFLGIAQWIWKVSTCLLVLQFVIPMRRHWHRAGRAGKAWHRRAADRVVAVSYLVPMAVAAMASVLLSLVLLALALAEKLPIPRIDQAVRWVGRGHRAPGPQRRCLPPGQPAGLRHPRAGDLEIPPAAAHGLGSAGTPRRRGCTRSERRFPAQRMPRHTMAASPLMVSMPYCSVGFPLVSTAIR